MSSAILQPLALPLDGLRLIEASAGTGKTYTIAMLYLRLVLGHQRDLPPFEGRRLLPPDILVLTFTDAAAGELRDRIRQRLTEAATVFRQGGEGGDALLRELVADYPDARHDEAAFLLEQAAQWLDEAAISTIHAWCLRVLQQHAFDSGSLFSQTLVQDLAALRDQVVRDVWRQWFYPLPAPQAALIAELLGDPDRLARKLQPLLAAGEPGLCRDGVPAARDWRAAWAALARTQDLLGAARVRLWQGWDAHGAEILPMLIAATERKQLKNTSYKLDWLNALTPAMQRWQQGGEAPAKLDKLTPEALAAGTSKGGITPEHGWFAGVADYLQLADSLQAPRQALELALLDDFAGAVRAGLEARLRERAEMGFDDLLKRVDAALRGPHGERLAERLREQYPVALIDEFQDTDPLQFRLFRSLYENRPDTALLMIGDPKQAIYSFRGADLPTYLAARELAQTPHHTLDTNFRSDQALVDAVNAVFSYAGQWPDGAFGQGGDALPFQPVRAQRRQSPLRRRTASGALSELPALQLALPDDFSLLPKSRAELLLADRCADTIAGWLGEGSRGELGFEEVGTLRAIGPGDIAVLVRKGREARILRRALQARGIPSVYGSDRDSVYASREAEQLQIWLEAFAEPAREDRLRLALATPALGRDWAALAHLRRDERAWEDEVEQVRQCHEVWRTQGVLAAVRQWLFHHRVPARLLHPDWLDGERALTNLLHLAELLQSAATGLHGEQALIRHLAECRDGGDQSGSQDALVRLESDSARVRVVTLHQSKGLEYPLVCLPFTALPGGQHRDAWRRYHKPDGELVLDLDTGKDSNASRQAAAEQLQEDLRLFYVGLTRARHLLWLALLPVSQGGRKDSLLQQTPWAHVLAGAAELASDALPAALARFLAEVPQVQAHYWSPASAEVMAWQAPPQSPHWQPALAFRGLRGEPWRISSYSGLKTREETLPLAPRQAPAAEDTAQAETFREQTLSGLAALPRGAEIGSFWHSLLEEAAALGFATDPESTAVLDDFIARQCRQRQWTDQTVPLQQALRGWLRHVMTLPAQADGSLPAPLALQQLRSYQVELEFWLASHGVDVVAVDALVCRHTLSGRARPAMAAARLNGLFKGFMDLVFEYQGRYYVADYKSNYLAADVAEYHPEALAADIAKHRYDLQYVLYLLALHRQLRARLPDYDYDRHIGGAVYLYLRGWDGEGHGVHVERPPRQLIEALDALFAGVEGRA